jgi:hypothetical protein
VFIAIAGAGLYFLRTVRPELSRDHDLFFAAVGLLCGLILIFQGWRLDPILQFGQFLMTGSAIFFAVETIRLRGATTEQARRSSNYVDDDRRVSKTRVYTEAELDRLEPYEENTANSRRLRGYSEPRSNREEDYKSPATRPRRTRRPTSGDRPTERYGDETSSDPRPRRPRSRPSSSQSYDGWEDPQDVWEEMPPSRRRPRRPDSPATTAAGTPPPARPRSRPRPNEESVYDSPAPADYVDYHPIDETEEPPSKDWDESRHDNPPSRSDRPDDAFPHFDY